MMSGVAGGEKSPRCLRGVITVYLSVVTMLLVSVTMVSLESARIAILRTSSARYADMAAEMLFSAYVKPLAERYGIFLLDEDVENCQVWFRKYLEMNCGGDGEGSLPLDPLPVRVSLDKGIKLSDSKWEPFLEQIRRCQIYEMGEDGADKVLDIFRTSDTSRAMGLKDEFRKEMEREADAAIEEIRKSEEERARGEGKAEESASEESTSYHEKDLTEEEPSMEDPRSGVSRWIKGGLLNLVMEGKSISGARVDCSDCSYSVKSDRAPGLIDEFEDQELVAKKLGGSQLEQVLGADEYSSAGSSEDIWTGGMDSLLLDIYIMDRFAALSGNEDVPEGERALSYELEYILYGASSDRENLESAISGIYVLRTALNLAYLYTDSSMEAVAGEAAEAMLTVALPGVAQLMKLLLMVCWAGAESVVDCRILADGGKVPVWKDESSWNLGFSQLMEIAARGGNPSSYAENSKRGLSYRQYLMIFLLPEAKKKKIIRAIQLMEKNIRMERGYSGLSLKNCLSGAVFSAEFSADPVFFLHPSGTGWSLNTAFQYSK